MGSTRISVVIPYKQRLDNLRLAFAALAEQSLGKEDFEIVVGALEYSPEYVELCRSYADRLRVVTVMADVRWNLSRARNLAVAQAGGDVLVFLDADMALPPNCLRNLWERHFAHGQRVCVAGGMIGYDDVCERDVSTVEQVPFDHYRTVLARLEREDVSGKDDRWSPANRGPLARFPWVYARGGFLALPAAVLHQHALHFDEGFDGWGPEDQEWGLRVAQSGTPILLPQDVYGLHLPHLRDVSVNGATAGVNNRYYLAKWPRRELELALSFGWTETDRLYPEAEAELTAAAGGPGRELAAVRALVDGTDTLVLGAVTVDGAVPRPTARDGADAATAARVASTPGARVLPLAGFGLPYPDGGVEECRILGPVMALGPRYRDAILREAARVACKVVTPTGEVVAATGRDVAASAA